MSRDVFITGCGSHLPGEPVGNDAIEDHIGRICGRPSLMGRRALRWNGIETRHYALDEMGAAFDTNAGMSAKAVNAALDAALKFSPNVRVVNGRAVSLRSDLHGVTLQLESGDALDASLLIGADGGGLSKRTGALSIAGLRESGVEQMAVAAMALPWVEVLVMVQSAAA